MLIPVYSHIYEMENPCIINLMREMKVTSTIDLEAVRDTYPADTKLYQGRPEMLVMRMTNDRCVQMFRGGKVQILGCILTSEAESMRLEFIERLKRTKNMRDSQVTKLIILNMVVSAQLVKKTYLRKINQSNSHLFYEVELFPAALIKKWHPVHVAVFHNGKVIFTGLKSVERAYEILSEVSSFLTSSHLLSEK